MWLSVQSVPAVCVRCAEIQLVMNLSKARDNALAHDRNPQPAAHKVQSQRHDHDFVGYAGVIALFKAKAFPFPPVIPASAQPMSEGCRLGEVSRCDWNTEPHSEEEATGQRGAKDLHQVHIFTVRRDLLPRPTQSRFRAVDSPALNRTVCCL